MDCGLWVMGWTPVSIGCGLNWGLRIEGWVGEEREIRLHYTSIGSGSVSAWTAAITHNHKFKLENK